MAGDWIKWTKGLASRREVVILASMLSRDPHEIAGRLMVLWEWCDENVTDQDVEPGTSNVSLILGDKAAAFVDARLGLPGMAEALASPGVKWIEFRSGGRCVFPNLARHNGTSAKTRAYESRKKELQRSRPAKASPEMSPEVGDKTGTREEKRRVLNPPISPASGGQEAAQRKPRQSAESRRQKAAAERARVALEQQESKRKAEAAEALAAKQKDEDRCKRLLEQIGAEAMMKNHPGETMVLKQLGLMSCQ